MVHAEGFELPPPNATCTRNIDSFKNNVTQYKRLYAR